MMPQNTLESIHATTIVCVRDEASVAIAGDTIVVGAKRKDETNFGAHGAAYVYRTSDGGATYSLMDKLAGSDDNGSFGASVAIDGSTVLVGESGGEDPDGVVFDGSRARSGVVHVFSSDASLWSSGALDSKGSSSGGSSGGSAPSRGSPACPPTPGARRRSRPTSASHCARPRRPTPWRESTGAGASGRSK